MFQSDLTGIGIDDNTQTTNKLFLQEFLEFEKFKKLNHVFDDEDRHVRDKEKLDKIFIAATEGISKELEQDLARNGADMIFKRQNLRKVDPDTSLFFEPVSVAPYNLDRTRKKSKDSTTRKDSRLNFRKELRHQKLKNIK